MTWSRSYSHHVYELGYLLQALRARFAARWLFRLVANNGDDYYSAEGWLWVGHLLRDANRLAEAKAAYRRCIDTEIFGTSGSAAAALAWIVTDQGDRETAINIFYTAMRLGEQFVCGKLARLLREQGDHEAADALDSTERIEHMLLSALHYPNSHDDPSGRSWSFGRYIVSVLRRREALQHIEHAFVECSSADDVPPYAKYSYLVVTNYRLLVLEDIQYPHSRRPLINDGVPDWVAVSVDRCDIVRVAPIAVNGSVSSGRGERARIPRRALAIDAWTTSARHQQIQVLVHISDKIRFSESPAAEWSKLVHTLSDIGN